ncbi:MAG: aspartate aminotransferase [Alphaproteobacteria bacterium CG_4_10_14_0_8_um_filter_37_21]|nr:MAG: aspartate aminotransferase [Alphaproteobacteria bacterium CG_4_10_14_0_8_um_filter_37_21]
MNILAKRLDRIKLSPTLQIMAQAQKAKAEGKDMLILAAGELDFDTPDFIKQAAGQAMEQGLTRYTAVDGLPAFKKAIQDKFLRDNKLNFALDEIMVSAGAKQVLFNAMLATIEQNDEVIIPAPYWPSYTDVVLLFNGIPIIVHTEERFKFKMTPDQLRCAITDKTKWVFLNSPGNPSGAVYSKAELAALAVVLREFPHVYVLTDDIYEHITFNIPFYTILNAAPDLKERTLILNGLSKAFSMTGWRLGYGAGPKQLIKAMTKVQSQSTTNANSIAQGAGVIALNSNLSFLDTWKKELLNRRDVLVTGINNIEGLSCNSPDGAFYLYINCADLLGKVTPNGQVLQNDHEICAYFLDYGVAVVPGSAFGLSPYFRVSFAASMTDLEKAVVRLGKAVTALM